MFSINVILYVTCLFNIYFIYQDLVFYLMSTQNQVYLFWSWPTLPQIQNQILFFITLVLWHSNNQLRHVLEQ